MILRALTRVCVEVPPCAASWTAARALSTATLCSHAAPSPISMAFARHLHVSHPAHGKHTKSKAKETELPASADVSFSSEELISSCDTSMTKAIDYLKQELAGVRSGRAHPGLLESLQVNAHGEHVPLKATAAVVVRNNATLAVMVYDPSLVDAVLTAIRTSPLELKAETEGGEIIVPIPRLSKESLSKMAKLVKKEAEDAKVSVRHSRQKALDALKKAPLSGDERRALEREVQKLHDKYVKDVDTLRAAKEKDLQEHH